MNRYKINTEMNGTQSRAIWWEVETNTMPITGMDNFDRLEIFLIQRETEQKDEPRTTKTGNASPKKAHRVKDNSVSRNQDGNEDETKLKKLKESLTKNFHQLFNCNHTLKNFEYNVQYKNKMTIKEQKGRRIPIHMQRAVETEIEKLKKEGHIDRLEGRGEDIFVSPFW